jgi:hypothetical protein
LKAWVDTKNAIERGMEEDAGNKLINTEERNLLSYLAG